MLLKNNELKVSKIFFVISYKFIIYSFSDFLDTTANYTDKFTCSVLGFIVHFIKIYQFQNDKNH